MAKRRDHEAKKKKKSLNEGLATYNAIRRELAIEASAKGLNLGRRLNSEASGLYSEFKRRGLVLNEIPFLVDEYFQFSGESIDWFDLSPNIAANARADDLIVVDQDGIGGEVYEFTFADSTAPIQEATKFARDWSRNKSGLRYIVSRDGSVLKYEVWGGAPESRDATKKAGAQNKPSKGLKGPAGIRPLPGKESGRESAQIERERLKLEQEKVKAASKERDRLEKLLRDGLIDQETFAKLYKEV